MFSSNACRFVHFFLLSLLSVNAETVRGAQRELDATPSVLIGTATNYQILAKSGISSVPACPNLPSRATLALAHRRDRRITHQMITTVRLNSHQVYL
jgi:hypothetical protein